MDDLMGYWRDNPPEHEMLQVVAAGLGWKPARREPPRPLGPMTPDEIATFEQLVNGGA